MASLASYYASNLVGFFSYSREDDTDFNDELSKFRSAIQAELSAQLGRNRNNFRIWQDRFAIPHGAEWQQTINDGIKEAAFFVPIITPRAVSSSHCLFEFNSFLAREQELNRKDLVFPILYMPVPELEDGTWQDNPVLKIVHDRQYLDWRDYRPLELSDPKVRTQIIQFCRNVSAALRKPWQTPEERQQQQEAEAQRKAEEELKRRTTEIALQKALDDERERIAAEVARRAAETERREKERLEREEREKARRRQEEALAAQRADEERAFAAAKRAGTVAAIDDFLNAHANSSLGSEARKLQDALLVRREAHAQAIASDDRAKLRSFCKTYKHGADVDEARDRLRRLAPQSDWKLSGQTMAVAVSIAALLLVGGGVVWHWYTSGQSMTRASLSVNAPVPANFAPIVKPTSAVAPSQGSTPALSNPTVPAVATSACSPGVPQKADFMGGPLAPIMLKLADTPKPLRSIAISPDGQTLATAGDDGIIRIWDATNLKLIKQLPRQTAPVYSVAYSDDGNLLASAGWDSTVRIWDGQSFVQQQVLTADADKAVALYDVAFEPGPKPRYVDSAGSDGNVWIWRMASSNPPLKRPSGDLAVRSLSFAPHGQGDFVSANFDGYIRFHAAGKTDPVRASPSKVLRVAYSPDAKLVASAGVETGNKGLKVWNVATRTLFKIYEGHVGYATSVAWSKDSGMIVSGGGAKDRSVRLWDVQSGAQLKSFSGHTADVEAVAFHPNQQWVISGSEDGTLKLWNIADGKLLLSSAGYENGTHLAYAPNGCYTGSDDAPNYIKLFLKDANGIEQEITGKSKEALFLPGDSTAALLRR